MTQFCLLEQPWALLEVPETEFHEIEVFLEAQELLMHAPIQATLLSLLFFLQSASPRCHSFIPTFRPDDDDGGGGGGGGG